MISILTNSSFYRSLRPGLHGGSLTVAEVGAEKKEIAYHGDVINTASRIQEVCSKLNEEVPNFLKVSCGSKHTIKYKPLGPIDLKGRSAPIELMAIEVE